MHVTHMETPAMPWAAPSVTLALQLARDRMACPHYLDHLCRLMIYATSSPVETDDQSTDTKLEKSCGPWQGQQTRSSL